MKKMMSAILVLIMTAVSGVTMACPVQAEEMPAVAVPVQISLSGTLPDPAEDYVVELKADDRTNPMPEGTKNGICSMTITGAGSRNFPAITYDKAGIYSYTIYQDTGANDKCTYDDTVYSLTVYVTNAENGKGLETAAVLYPDIKSSKQSGAEFENEYESETEQTEMPETDESEMEQTEMPKTDESETEQTEMPKTDESETEQTEMPKTDTPGTGDDTNLLLYIVLAGVSVILFAGLFVTRRSRKPEE